MAYCRFGRQCDVYAYPFIGGGYQIHVADGRSYFEKTAEAAITVIEALASEGLEFPKEHVIHRMRAGAEKQDIKEDV